MAAQLNHEWTPIDTKLFLRELREFSPMGQAGFEFMPIRAIRVESRPRFSRSGLFMFIGG
jgi:hypothetical protein